MATNSHSTVFAYTYNKDNVDCLFHFIDEPTSEVKEFAAHRKVLAAHSPVFEVMFGSTWNDAVNPICIEDATYETFATFMEYFYETSITLTIENAAGILHLADKYDVKRLVDHCETFLIEQLTVRNVLINYWVAVRYERDQLQLECCCLMKRKYMEILEADSFLSCGKGTLAALLRPLRNASDVTKIFDACVKWAEVKCNEDGIDKPVMKDLRMALGECFGLIGFEGMSVKEFMVRYDKYKEMFTSDESNAIFIHLLKSLEERHFVKPLDKWKLTFTGVCEYREEAAVVLCFRVSKPLILQRITVAKILRNGKLIDFLATVSVQRNQRELFKCIADFTVNNRQFVFRKKFIVDAFVTYKIVLGMMNCLISCQKGFTHKRQRIGDVDFVPVDNGGNKESLNGVHCLIESLEFINFDD